MLGLRVNTTATADENHGRSAKPASPAAPDPALFFGIASQQSTIGDGVDGSVGTERGLIRQSEQQLGAL